MSDEPMMWAPGFADVDNGLLNEPVVMFSPEFTEALARWEAEFGHPHATWRLKIQADDGGFKAALITYREAAVGGIHRIWRLNGEMDERGGYIGVWPD